jgi:hypothetical protein
VRSAPKWTIQVSADASLRESGGPKLATFFIRQEYPKYSTKWDRLNS